MSDPSYPVGRHTPTRPVDVVTRTGWIDEVRRVPAGLENAVRGLDDARLDTPYRSGGWTIRQVVHHVADSHMNAYCRLKLALTEEEPTIRPYDQDAWASLPDSNLDIAPSLAIVRAVHTRMVCLFEAMTEEDFQRPLHHPEIGPLRAIDLLDIYQWHGRHHVAHITQARKANGW